MNINQDPLGRRESTLPPSPEERAAMRATRDLVRTSRGEMNSAPTETKRQGDRIEISTEASEGMQSIEANEPQRLERIERLRAAYQSGELNSEARVRSAAERMLSQDDDTA